MGRRVLLSVMGSVALVALAISALFVTSSPRLISLLVEPFSLLLLPGLAVAMVLAGLHDYSSSLALLCSFAFYFVVFYAALQWRARRRHERR